MQRQATEVCTLALYPEEGEQEAAIVLSAGAGIRGLSLIYPEQSLDVSTLKKYPWTIRGNGAGCWTVDLVLLNSYNGIDMASAQCDNAVLRGIWSSTFYDMIKVGGGSDGVVMEHVAGSYGPWLESGRARARGITDEQKQVTSQWFKDSARYFVFEDCSNVKTWGLAGFHSAIQVVFDKGAKNGLGCTNSEFWHNMYDVPQTTSIDAKYGHNISFFVPFMTNHSGQNYARFADSFKGPINLYGPTIQSSCYEHSWKGSKKQFEIFNEITFVTGKKTIASNNTSQAENVVDRDEYSYWEGNKGDWIQIDLGADYCVTHVVLISAWLNGDKEPFLSSGKVFLSTDGKKFDKGRRFDTSKSLKQRGLFIKELKNQAKVRYVRIQVDGNTKGTPRIRLAEVRVYPELPQE
jgi:hypothetical protein